MDSLGLSVPHLGPPNCPLADSTTDQLTEESEICFFCAIDLEQFDWRYYHPESSKGIWNRADF